MARVIRIAGSLAVCGLVLWLPSAPAGGQVPVPGQPAPSSETWSPTVEAQNYSKIEERQTIYDTPQYQAQLRTQSQANSMAANEAMLNDPGRQFATDLCWNQSDGCAGDVRLYNWGPKGYGIVAPVLYTARDGATISGRIWATRAGPANRPGVIITNGSVQADEQMYWYAAQALAKDGYVVMTWDPQGQGQSDTRGEAPDQNEGFPAQSDGRPFFDGTEDAINFFYSNPSHPYVPESSCSTGTSHAPKQRARVAAGLDAPYNPYWSLFNGRVGLAGHSYGAAGVSFIGQWDPRVDAIVAWDNLSQPASGSAGTQSFPPGEGPCPAHPADRADLTNADPSKAKPALGMSADYFLPPEPNTSPPRTPAQCKAIEQAYEQNGTKPSEQEGLDCKSFVSDEYSRKGIDTGEIVIRGGSHLDFSWIPNQAFGATLRGADEIAWYTAAWMDRYVKLDPTADARLLTNRWRTDGQEAAIDPNGDGNTFSFYHLSRLDFHTLSGQHIDCEDLRHGCPALTSNDGWQGDYSYIAIDTSADSTGPGAAAAAGSTAARHSQVPCLSRRTITVHLGHPRGARILSVIAYAGRHRVGTSRGSLVVLRLAGLRHGSYAVRLRVVLRQASRRQQLTITRRYRTCTPRTPRRTRRR